MNPFILNILSRLKNLEAPSPDNIDNVLMRDVIGNRNDNHSTGTLFGALHDLWEMENHVQLIYPSLAAAVTVTADGGDWVLGTFAEIVPVDTIDTDFHIHHLHISEPSADKDYELVLYNVSTIIGKATFSRTAKKDAVEGLPVKTMYSPANTQIRAKLACSGGGASAKVKIWYHPHR